MYHIPHQLSGNCTKLFFNDYLMVDNTMYEGLIVAQYYGEKKGDNYLELLQNKGFRRRIYMVDVKEYGIILK